MTGKKKNGGQNTELLELVNRHMGIALKICRVYFYNTDFQADAFQEMMFQLWKAYPSFRGKSKFSTWMYRVCLNTAITYLRTSKNSENISLSGSHVEIADKDNSEAVEMHGELYKAINQLSPLNKAIILLHLDELSYEEIADITGLTRTNVSVRLVRIRKELETILNHNGYGI